ncbi:MAG: hypothetical protein AAF598_13440 [Bacteroidota bacterium]
MKSLLKCMLLLFALLALYACTDTQALEQAQTRIAELEAENAGLQEDKSLIRDEYNDAIDIMNQIDEELIGIDAREKQMENLIGDLSGNELQRELILARIEVLKEENGNAQKSAKDLQNRLNKYISDNKSLNKTIRLYEKKLEEKEAEIAAYEVKVNQIEAQLKYTEDELATQYAIVERTNDSLQTKNQELIRMLTEIQEKDVFIADCVKAYYMASDRKTLRQLGILRKGGMRLTDEYQNLMVRDFPVDMYHDMEYEFEGNIVAILPERPENTYRISENALEITNPETFWKNRDMVVVLK